MNSTVSFFQDKPRDHDCKNALVGAVACPLRGDRTPEMELIVQAESSREPDGAHMVDPARLF